MTEVVLKQVDHLSQYVTADGRLTLQGLELIQRIIEATEEAQTMLDDHEARITALEP